MMRQFGIGAAALTLLLALWGCGGGGDGPTVTQTIHDELQADLDAALADLEATEGQRDRARSDVVRLTTELAASRASVAQLEGHIGRVDDEADADGSLHAQLNAAEARATALTALIGATGDAADASATASLYAQLNHANAEVTRLTTLVGNETTPAATSLRGQLATANANVTRLTRELATANATLTQVRGTQTTAATQLRSLQTQLTTARQQVTTLTAEVTRLRAAAGTTGTTPATTTPTTPTVRVPSSQSAEATQRARNLMTAFGDVPTSAQTLSSPIMMDPPSRNSLRIRHGSRSTTLSGTGIRSATIALTGTGDTGKTVIYTDRELRRPVLEHFGNARNGSDRTLLNVGTGSSVELPSSIPHFSTTPPATTMWRIARPSTIPPSLAPVDNALPSNATEANTKMADSYTGYLYGQSGSFVCRGGTSCKVRVAPTYETSLVTGSTRYALESMAVTATGGDSPTLHFRPSSNASYQLYEGGPVGPDNEYMVFGYWREDPASPAGTYQFEPFAAVTGTPPTSATATYDGTAVGAYVEKDPSAAVDTYRQGEFTADVFLTAAGATISGTIDDFRTTPTGGSSAPRTASRWVVTLVDGGNVRLNLPGGSTDDGQWAHAFVPAHGTVATGTEPPAVVGEFDARIANSVAIVGAFGAERR